MLCGFSSRAIRGAALFVFLFSSATSIFLTKYFLKEFVDHFITDDFDLPTCEQETDNVTAKIRHLLVPRRRRQQQQQQQKEEEEEAIMAAQEEEDVNSALDIMNKHGVGFFQDLLSSEQSEALRNYILRENKNNHRYRANVQNPKFREHLTFGLDEDPTVTDAIQSIVTSQPLRGVLEKMLGKNAALVELASITAYPGAWSQEWHKDTTTGDRDVHLYSLFIPLQQTTKEMGATAMIQNTHFCEPEWAKDIVYASTEAGTGGLMNSRLTHRGGANSSPNNKIRVMFYLSFTEGRYKHNSNRVLPYGATYAIREDQLGRSLSQIINRSYHFWSAVDFWSHDRGWNYFELAASNLADGKEIPYLEWNEDEIKDKAKKLSSLAIGSGIVIVILAAKEFLLDRHRRKDGGKQQGTAKMTSGEDKDIELCPSPIKVSPGSERRCSSFWFRRGKHKTV